MFVMKKYTAQVEFTFKGTLKVEANNREEAAQLFKEGFGMTLSGGVDTNLPSFHMPDWEFDMHPDKTVLSKIKLNK